MPKIGKRSAARVVRHKVYGTPQKAYPLKVAPRKGTPRSAAQGFLRGVAKDLRIGKDLKDLKFDKVIQSPLGTHVLFQQHHHGRKISGAWVKVDLDHQNRVYHFTNSCVPVDLLAKSEKAAKCMQTGNFGPRACGRFASSWDASGLTSSSWPITF